MSFQFNPTLLAFMRKEFAQVLRDKRMRMLLFIAPVMQLILFGLAISSDVKNVRLSFVPRAGDTVLEHAYQHAIASGWFIPAQPHHQDPFEQIQADEADAVLVPPPEGLTTSLGRGDGHVQFLINASNVLRAQAVEGYMQTILASVAAQDLKAAPQVQPINFNLRILYNPSMRTAVFMVPSVMSMLVCLITILLTSMSISHEKETGTFETLIAAPVRPWEIILGKTLPYVVLGLSNIPLILAVAVIAFGVPMRGSLLVLLLCSLIFVCVTVGIGTLISTLTQNQQQSMMAGFLFLFPAIQLSGLLFPLENMPTALRVLADLNPLTHFLEILRNIMLKGGDRDVLLVHCAALIAMGVVVITVSFKKFHTTLR